MNATPVFSAVELDADNWARHYGEQWERRLAAKHRFDRSDVLASGADVLGRCLRRLSSPHERRG